MASHPLVCKGNGGWRGPRRAGDGRAGGRPSSHGPILFLSPTGTGGGEAPALPVFPTAGDVVVPPPPIPSVIATGGIGAAFLGGVAIPTSMAGLGALPQKLTKRIAGKEFIDMRELLPESWRSDSQQSGSIPAKSALHGPVKDFKLWAECYAVLAGVLVLSYPEKAPQLMAYLRLMSRASRNYETDAWVEYDTAFRRRAANCGSLDWGTIDSGLYNETFTGRARPIKRCSYCVVDTHALEECPYAPKGWSQQESGTSHESRVRTTQRTPGSARVVGRLDSGRSDAVEICRLFNEPGARCSYPACRYAHLCTRCHRPHPQFECGKPKRGRSRSPPPPRGDRKPRR